jgi:hypothetical protein
MFWFFSTRLLGSRFKIIIWPLCHPGRLASAEKGGLHPLGLETAHLRPMLPNLVPAMLPFSQQRPRSYHPLSRPSTTNPLSGGARRSSAGFGGVRRSSAGLGGVRRDSAELGDSRRGPAGLGWTRQDSAGLGELGGARRGSSGLVLTAPALPASGHQGALRHNGVSHEGRLPRD